MKDEFTYSSAAYALDLLDLPDRRAFERHLAGCAGCVAATAEAAALRGLLAMLPTAAAERLMAAPAPGADGVEAAPAGAAADQPDPAGRPAGAGRPDRPSQPRDPNQPDEHGRPLEPGRSVQHGQPPEGGRSVRTGPPLWAVPPPGTAAPTTPPLRVVPPPLRAVPRPNRAGRNPADRRSGLRLIRGGLAAASLVVLGGVGGAVVAHPAPPKPTGEEAAATPRAFTEIGTDPVRATAALVPTRWGTQLQVWCTYTGAPGFVKGYQLLVRDRGRHTEQLSTWQAIPNQEVVVRTSTDLAAGDVSGLEIRTDTGRTVLRLDL